ncbi:MAG: hypothetical protein Q4P06_03750 [Actinomycetaceae bacterium]|nr:hypothetical protein [Actinomycetaceae bacterium]
MELCKAWLNVIMDLASLILELEEEFSAMGRYQEQEEIAELAEAEASQTTLEQRLQGAVGKTITAHLRNLHIVEGKVLTVGPRWLLVLTEEGQELVSLSHVEMFQSLGHATAREQKPTQVSFNAILRKIARGRNRLAIYVGGRVLNGFIVAVRKDHFDVVEVDRPRHAIAVPNAAVSCLRIVLF